MQQLRQAVLRNIGRIPVQQTSSNPAAAALSSFWRGFAGGGYLDKDEVTQRVLHVTKHFEKIDPAKVGCRRGEEEQDLGGRPQRRRLRCAPRCAALQRSAAFVLCAVQGRAPCNAARAVVHRCFCCCSACLQAPSCLSSLCRH